MPIDIQVKSFLFSFFFGLIFSVLLRLNYRYMYKGSMILKIVITMLFVVDNVLIYFIILRKLNNGIIHNYFLLTILFGFVIMELIFKKIPFDLRGKKWYSYIVGMIKMARKITRKTKRRLLLITFITSVILFAFVINLWKMFSQVISKNKEAVFLRSEIERLEEEEAYLKIEVEKLNDPEYVARYARERFLYSKDGEFTIKIPETH